MIYGYLFMSLVRLHSVLFFLVFFLHSHRFFFFFLLTFMSPHNKEFSFLLLMVSTDGVYQSIVLCFQ